MATKEQTVKFIVEADNGVKDLKKVNVELHNIKQTMQKTRDKGIVDVNKEVSKVSRVENAFKKFTAGIDNADKKVTKLFQIVWKIGRSILLIKATLMFINKIGLGKSLSDLFFKEKKFKFPSKTEILSEYKDFASEFEKVFSGVFERSSAAGARAKIFKNVLEAAKGEKKRLEKLKAVGKVAIDEMKKTEPLLEKAIVKMGIWTKGLKKSKINTNAFKNATGEARKEVSLLRRILWEHIFKKNPFVMLAKESWGLIRGLWKIKKNLKGMNNAFGDGVHWAKKLFTTPLKAGLLLATLKGISMGLQEVWKQAVKAEKAIVKSQIFSKGGTRAEGSLMYNMAEKASELSRWTPQETADAAATMTSYGFTKEQIYEKGGLGKELGDTTGMQALYGMQAAGGMGLAHATQAMMRGEVALLDKYKHARDVYNKLVAEGMQIGSNTFRMEFIKGIAKIPEYARAARIESETMEGAMSTISGSTEMMLTAFSGVKADAKESFSFWSSIRRILNHYKTGAVELVKFLKPFLNDLGSIFGLLFESLYSIWQIMKPILIVYFAPLLIKIYLVVKFLKWALWLISKILKGIVVVMKFLIDKVIEYVKWMGKVTGITSVLTDVLNWVKDTVVMIKMSLQFLGAWLKTPIRAIKKLIRFLKDMVHWLKKMLAPIGNWIEKKLAKPLEKFLIKHGVITTLDKKTEQQRRSTLSAQVHNFIITDDGEGSDSKKRKELIQRVRKYIKVDKQPMSQGIYKQLIRILQGKKLKSIEKKEFTKNINRSRQQNINIYSLVPGGDLDVMDANSGIVRS